MKISTIDIFCGIGGLSYGLKKAGIPIVSGVDLDKTCKFAYEENVCADFIEKDITELSGYELMNQYWKNDNEIHVLVGCAPCQPFSTHSNKIRNKENNNKWFLIKEFGRLVKELNPDIVSMENVPNIANQIVFKEFLDLLRECGYFVSYKNVFCPNYGIPQKRRRIVLFASKYGEIELIPETHTRSNYVTLREAIGFLPEIEAGKGCSKDPLHKARNLSEKNLQRIVASKPNGTWLDWDDNIKANCHKRKSGKTYKSVYGRMSWDEPSSTITTQFFNFGTGRFGHPVQNRALSIREGALLQTFPIDYTFQKSGENISMTRLGVQIGNAVPVHLGYIIGLSILNHMGKYYGRK